jgi:hypothetical protein
MDANAGWFKLVYVGATVDVAGSSHAVSMADFEASNTKTIADFNVAPSAPFPKGNVTAFLEPLEGDQAYTAVFVGKIWP